ncbi:MAG TPA: hypothetical protein VIK02_01870 [Candidatus Anoxymicrobiaceae bacterium]
MRTRQLFSSESGQILRKIITFGVIFAVIILIVVEVGPLIWQRFDVAQSADDMANAAANTYNAYRDQTQVVREFTDKLRLSGYTDAEISQAQILFLPAGGPPQSIRVTVVKYADTLITKHISALKKFAKISATHEVAVTQ